MYRSAKISSYQLFAILGGFLIGSSLIVSPSVEAKQDAWLAFTLGSLGGGLLLSIYVWIARLNPNCSLIAILQRHFGKFLGKFVAVAYLWYFTHLASLVLRNFGEFSITTSYPETPILFVVICFAFTAVLAVREGVETIGRISEIFLFILALITVFVFCALFASFDFEALKPFLANGIKPVIKTSFSILAFPYGETVVFLMIFPYVNKQKNLFRASNYAVLVVFLLLGNMIVRNTMVLGAEMASRAVFPSHIVFRLIPNLDVDPLLDINLGVAGIVKVSVLVYAVTTALAELLGVDDFKPFVFPLAALSVSMSIWVYSSLMEMIQWATDIWPYYSIPFQIIIPFALLIISLIKKQIKSKKAMS